MALESKTIELGKSCPSFELPGVDGKIHRLQDYQNAKALVVGMTCNHCPYVQAYEERLIALVDEFKSRGVSFVCINSNDESAYPEDSMSHMIERAKSKSFNFAYLRDDTQKVARAFDAACTPEFYLYDHARKLAYHGRLDDSPKDPHAVKIRYLKDALEAVLSDREVKTPQTFALGCSIKWK